MAVIKIRNLYGGFLRKYVAIGIVLVLTSLFTACGSAGGELRDNTLIFAKLVPGDDFQAHVDAFNAAHTDVQIEIRNYWGDTQAETKQNYERLMVEMAAGKIPDIINIGSFSAVTASYLSADIDIFPYQQLARKGYFEDLWPYIENDPELGREGILEAPLKAAEIDGGLYILFSAVVVQTLVGAESVVGNRSSWTLRDLQTTFAAMPEDSTVLEYFYDKYEVCEVILPMMLDSYIDWESGQCSFDDAAFREALEFINSFPDEADENGTDEQRSDEVNVRMRSGRQMLALSYITGIQSVQKYDILFGGRSAFVGYPVEDGSTGSCFMPYGRMLAMSSTCRNKDAAWEFIRQYLLPSEEHAMNLALSIPVNLSDYNRVKNFLQNWNTEKMTWHGTYYDGPEFTYSRSTTEEIQRFENLVNSIDKFGICDENLYNIILDQCGAYFAGDKTLDDTIRLINNRVKLYVNEQK